MSATSPIHVPSTASPTRTPEQRALKAVLTAWPQLTERTNSADIGRKLQAWVQNQIALSRQESLGDDPTPHRRGG